VPKKVVLLEEMPKTGTGKIRKNVLKEEHQNLFQEE
jgi:acyl-coenzyme A synthetase/AMP-(fatty) acid ligase